ncbi:MAG: hypothetical protein KAI83_17980, partial [Thiomargarita sp.]|nr:hypothetical protein [Thiomargarita sp.]
FQVFTKNHPIRFRPDRFPKPVSNCRVGNVFLLPTFFYAVLVGKKNTLPTLLLFILYKTTMMSLILAVSGNCEIAEIADCFNVSIIKSSSIDKMLIFWFPRASVNAIKLSQGEHAGSPLQAQNTRVFVGQFCVSALNLMALTRQRGNEKSRTT